MNLTRRLPSKITTESFLIGILHLIGLLSLYTDDDKRGRPYVYPTCTMVRCYVTKIWLRIPSNNCLHHYTINGTYNKKIMRSCGLDTLPDRRTFDRRFKIIPIRQIIGIMRKRFVTDGIVDCTITSVDSSMVRAKNGRVLHRNQMASGNVPRPGIDIDARWGFSGTKGWIFGYKIHMSCSTGKLVVPLSASVTCANVYDNQEYQNLVEHLPDTIRYIVADAGYDDKNLYDFTRQRCARIAVLYEGTVTQKVIDWN